VLEESPLFHKFGPVTDKIVNVLFDKVSGDEKEVQMGALVLLAS
jgi:hypothetical protein